MFVVTHRSVNKQHGEVRRIEVSDWSAEPRCHRPGKRHDEIATDDSKSAKKMSRVNAKKSSQIIRVSKETPPAGSQEFRPRGSLHELEFYIGQIINCNSSLSHGELTFWVPAITEFVFLAVRVAENPVSSCVQAQDGHAPENTQLHGMERQVSSLKGVNERYPSQVSHRKHEAEAVRNHIHSGK